MTKCSFKFCKSVKPQNPKNDGMSYYRFPKDLIRREKWIEIVKRQRGEPSFVPNTASLVCSNHFNESDLYESATGVKRVRKTAVPRVGPDTSCVEIKKEIEDEIITQSSSCEDPSQPGTSKLSYNNSSNAADTNDSGDEIGKKIKIEVEEFSPNIAVEYKDNRLNYLMTRDNNFDKFGEYVATMLKKMPLQQALDLQPQIVNLITSTANDCGDGSKSLHIKIEGVEN